MPTASMYAWQWFLPFGAVATASAFTLVVQKQGDRWRILHDHTSSDPKP